MKTALRNRHQKAAFRPGEARVSRARVAERQRAELARMRRPQLHRRGKCDFCGKRDDDVREDFETRIPTAGLSRAALVCRSCPATGR